MRDFSRLSVMVAAYFLLTSGSLLQAHWGFSHGMGGGRQIGDAQAGSVAVLESISFKNIKAGDRVMATGVLKNGALTVLKMGAFVQRAAGET